MVKSCAAYGCTNRANGRQKDLKFFRFPSNPHLFTQWVRNLKRGDAENGIWKPNQHSRICSRHFKPGCFHVKKGGSRARLIPDAVPTEFDFQTSIKKKPKKKYTKKVVQSRIENTNCHCILSKSIDVPDLLNILPSEYSYALCDLEKRPNSEFFQCRFRINISTKEAAIEWLQQFTVSNVNYKYEPSSEDTQNHIYKVQLKCAQDVRTDKSMQHTIRNVKCPAKLTLIVKRTSLVEISKDIHLEEFPTEVLLFHPHNHPTNCAKKLKKRTLNTDTMKTFLKLLESGCTPSSKVLQYINELHELQNSDQDGYILGPDHDGSMVERKNEVLRYINELQSTDQDEYILGSDHDCSMAERKIEDTDDGEVSQFESYSMLSPIKTEGEIEQKPEILLLEKFQTELQHLYAKVRDNPSLLPAAEKFVEQSSKIDTVDALSSALSAFGRCGDDK